MQAELVNAACRIWRSLFSSRRIFDSFPTDVTLEACIAMSDDSCILFNVGRVKSPFFSFVLGFNSNCT